MTPDQETQQDIYRRYEESHGREQQPIKEAVGHATGDYAPLAIEDETRPEPVPGPKRPQPAPQDHSMRASDIDPLSGTTKPTEPPPTPWCDRKLQAGPPSERQRQRLEWERARRGAEGKQPFSD
jgi:hypothetical protein